MKAFRADDNKFVGDNGARANEIVVNFSKKNKSKKSTCMLNIGAIKKSNFLSPNAKKTFNYLQLAFIKAQILQYFDLKSHMQIEINASSYVISEMFSQLNLNSNIPLKNLNSKNLIFISSICWSIFLQR